MDKMLALGANITGFAGVLLTVVAGVTRLSSHYHLAGFEVMTLFTGGMGLMLIGIFFKLQCLTNQRS